ncbi:MAG: hypothetical protein EP318_13120 [Rhodobacteraceae bacterium]|nr:MAG: hypothetical protein EP318_13120 [Paracoccaceae bacterium]
MKNDLDSDHKRLFKSVQKEYDPRTVGTMRVGSLKFYQNHYDEAVADQGEGTGKVSITSGQSVTLNSRLASALTGLEIMGQRVNRPGATVMKVGEPGLSMALDTTLEQVTLSGAACTWEFFALDAFVFCMTSPSKSYSDTFAGERVTWSISRSDADEFSELVLLSLNQRYPAEFSFPYLSAMGAQSSVTQFKHEPVVYAPREAALDNTKQGQLAAMLFANATFIKPSGPPRYFEREEEYRFQFRRVGPQGNSPQRLPEFIDIPFAPVEHLVRFR